MQQQLEIETTKAKLKEILTELYGIYDMKTYEQPKMFEKNFDQLGHAIEIIEEMVD